MAELEQVVEKCGLPSFVLSDEGSDLAKGIRIFIERNPGIKHLNDISHKISNILKAELEKNGSSKIAGLFRGKSVTILVINTYLKSR